MSLYPSQSSFGQPPYSHYPQPAAHNGYQYQYPQPPPSIPLTPFYHQLDPVSFRREYTTRLGELSINSRPLIQNLSMLAQEYSRYADIVAQCIEGHIRRVPPWMKLPAFYLLDAISKNVYEPYARHFATFVITLFLETYGQVDEHTRSKMEEMLLTWRTGSPHGKELFGVATQVAIERGIWSESSSNHGPSSSFYDESDHITKAQVISELEFALGQKERTLQHNPYDVTSQNHVNVLHQLRKLVEAGVSQAELQQILSQLRTLVRSTAPPPPPAVVAPPAQWQPQPTYPTQTSNQSSFAPSGTLSGVGKMEVSSSTTTAPSTSTPNTTLAPPAEITNLLSNLLRAGVVSANGTPQCAGATSKEEAVKQQIIEHASLEREASRQYRSAILSQRIRLTTSDITKRQPKILEFLYDKLSAQCKQCGIRFADNITGKKSMEDHLDMHFRQNRKANQNIGRGHSRSWFIGAEDWVHDLSNAKGKYRADGSQRLNPKAAAAAENAKRDAELRAMFVVVPPGDEAKAISCPICKEILKSEFLEDDEDWVWKNAVKKDDKVYHATCHAEAVTSTSSLAARLRSELTTGRSRSATPETHSLRATPPPSIMRDSKSKSPSMSPSQLAGTKRKVDQNDSAVHTEDSPPVKKIALSTPLVS